MKRKIYTGLVFAFMVAVLLPAQTTRKFTLEVENGAPASPVAEKNAQTTSTYVPTGNVPELVVQEWHNNFERYIKYSADGRYIMTTGSEIKIWDVETGFLIRTIPIGYNSYSTDFSPDGRYVLYAPKFGFIELCEVLTGNIVFSEEIGGVFSDLLFTPDGESFIVIRNSDIWFYNVRTLQKTIFLHDDRYENKSQFATFSDDGRYLAVVASYKEESDLILNIVLDVVQKRIVSVTPFTEEIEAISISPDNAFVACGTNKGTVFIHRLSSSDIISSFTADSLSIYGVQFSPDGRGLYVAGLSSGLTFFDVRGNAISPYFEGEKEGRGVDSQAKHIAVSPDKKNIAVISSLGVSIRDVGTGRLLKRFSRAGTIFDVSPTKDDSFLMGRRNHFLWFNKNFTVSPLPDGIVDTHINEYAVCNTGIYYTDWGDYKKLLFYDFAHNEKQSILSADSDIENIVTSFDGNKVAFVTDETKIHVYDTQQNRIMAFDSKYKIDDFGLSPSGAFVYIEQRLPGAAVVYDTRTGAMHDFPNFQGEMVFSAHDTWCFLSEKLSSNHISNIYDTSTWKANASREWSVNAAFSPDERLLAHTENDGTGHAVIVITTVQGAQVGKIATQESYTALPQLLFTSDGKKIIIRTYAGIVRCYSVQTGELLVSTIADADGDWLTYTPEGYFTGSPGGINKFVHLVDGMQVFELGQLYDTLYRPDLVQAKLEGKDIGKPVLQDIVATGNAPDVYFTSVPAKSSSREAHVKFYVQDTGGGIGYVYLSHNGKVMQVSSGEEHKTGRRYVFDCTVTLANGKNEFEAYAANAAGKIESLHATATAEWSGRTQEANLYVLALGVNKYVRMPANNLSYSVADATALVQSVTGAPGGLYKSVNFMQLLDADVTKGNIQKAFDSFAAKVKPDDVFIFYIAGHGENYNGEYYFMPSDIQISDYAELPQAGVSKHFLMESLSKIPAQNSVILLDTCFSGSFLNAGQTSEIAQKTAIEHLAHTCGQVIITAASDAQVASEGYNGHGIFTYVLMEGLSGKANTDRNNRAVSMTELADYVKAEVPNISIKEFKRMQTPWVMFRQADFSVVSSTKDAPSPSYAVPLAAEPYQLAWFTKTIDDSFVNTYLAAVQNEEAAVSAATAGTGNRSSSGTKAATSAASSSAATNSSASSSGTSAGTKSGGSASSSTTKASAGTSSSAQAAPPKTSASVSDSGTHKTASKEKSAFTEQHSRGGPTSGIYFDITAPKGAFFEGTDVSFVYCGGGKHFFAGFDMMFSFLNLTGEYPGVADSIFMMDTNAFLGFSFNLWILRPYITAGGGYYFSAVTERQVGYSEPSGISLEGMLGLDLVFKKLVIGGVYKLRWLYGSGFVDDWGVSIGINW